MKIPRNVGRIDRSIRAFVAAVLGYLVLTSVLVGVWATVGTVVAVVMLATAFIGWCPPYSLLGINTCETK